MLLAYFCTILLFQAVNAQPRLELDAKGLDSLLQDYSFRALVRPKTGIIYDGNVPSNLTGIHTAALRLRSGSLRRKGVAFKEFNFPVGVVEQPYVERLVLVYHNLGNWSQLYYPLPGTYTFLAPVLGLLAYDAFNLTAKNPPELTIRASGNPISVTFPSARPGPSGMCVHFGLDGSVNFEKVVNGTTCFTTDAGHYSIVVESAAAPAPAPSPAPGGGAARSAGGKGKGRRVWIIVASVVGGVALVILLVVLFAYLRRCRRRKKIRRMERAAEVGVPLPMTAVGNTKAPVALETRTKPFLENEFVP
ncbi:transmembrane protein [Perilla frutescens var. frutescens]|nr:transmembrane protein [Perilla frutescens var. frutescens]